MPSIKQLAAAFWAGSFMAFFGGTPAKAEPVGYEPEVFSFSAQCASGAASCLWPMSQTDIIYWAAPPTCRVWSNTGGRHCADYASGKFTYGTNPYQLADLDLAATKAIEQASDETALPFKTLGKSNCVLGNSGSWILRCDVDQLKKTVNAQGQTVWVAHVLPGNLTVNQWGADGGRSAPCQGYVPGVGCPTAAAERASDHALGACSDPLGASLAPMCLQYPMAGNPISLLTGAKVESRVDFSGPIPFSRAYSSNNHPSYGLGTWRHNHDSYAVMANANPAPPAAPYAASINFRLEEGSDVVFHRTAPAAALVPVNDEQRHFKAEANAQGFLLTLPSFEKRQYDAAGLMLSRTWRSGYSWTYGYGANGRVNAIVDSYGRGLSIAYSGQLISSVSTTGLGATDQMTYGYQDGRLAWASFNASETEAYGYNPQGKLESITDPLGKTYARFAYDPSSGKAVQTHHVVDGQPTEQVDVAYSANQATVTSGGAVSVYRFAKDASTKLSRTISASIAGGATTYSVAYQGVATGFTVGGASTQHTLNSATLLPSRTQGPGGATTYAWDAATRLLTRSIQDSATGMDARKTDYAYDAWGNSTSVTVSSASSGSRTWSATYGSFGKMLTATGPDGATTSYEYHEDDHAIPELRGRLKSSTNALGFTTHYGHDSRGRVNSITDPNGVEATATLDARGRVLSTSHAGVSVENAYDLAGQLVSSSSGGVALSYAYDDAHRLASISSSNGDAVAYAYDAHGNRSQESASHNGALALVANRQFDALGRLKSSWGAVETEKTTVAYDEMSRPISAVDGLGRKSSMEYDALGNPTLIRGPGATASSGYGQTINRDSDGNAKYYKPDGWTETTFTWNDFGEMLGMSSPDSGGQTFTHNPATRVKTMTDALGAVHSATFDALGRPLLTTHAKAGLATMGEAFTYDEPGSKGMLGHVQDASGSTSWTWSAQGLPLTRSQTTGGVQLAMSYSYSSDGRLESITYPSGMVVDYGWDQGRVSSVSVNGQTLLSNVGYAPFSAEPSSWTWASGGSRQKTFDASGKITGVSDSGVMDQATEFDAGMRLTNLVDGAFSLSATYLPGDQLSSVAVNGQTQNYGFNAHLARTSRKNFDGSTDSFNGGVRAGQQWWTTAAGSFSPVYKPTLTYDERRSMTGNGRSTLTYDLRGDLATSLTAGVSASYAYNAFHQRVKKTIGAATTLFAYDDMGHLAGEYDASGAALQEHVYLGDTPVGVVSGGQTYAVHVDYLGTPRAVTQGSTLVWKWDATDPFGKNAPSIQTLVYNPRFPGQYHDAETGLHYNHHRTYDPELGRYLQSDPLGIDAGPDTVSYVAGNPLNSSDPHGLMSLLYIEDGTKPHIILGFGEGNEEKFYNLNISLNAESRSHIYPNRSTQAFSELMIAFFGLPLSVSGSPLSPYTSKIEVLSRKEVAKKYSKIEGLKIHEAKFNSSPDEDQKAIDYLAKEVHGTAYTLGASSRTGLTSQCTTSAEMAMANSLYDFPHTKGFNNRPIASHFLPNSLFEFVKNSKISKNRNLKTSTWENK